MPTLKVAQGERIRLRFLDDRAIAFDRATGDTHAMSAAGSSILKAVMAGADSEAGICNALTLEQFSSPGDFNSALADLVALRVLEVK